MRDVVFVWSRNVRRRRRLLCLERISVASRFALTTSGKGEDAGGVKVYKTGSLSWITGIMLGVVVAASRNLSLSLGMGEGGDINGCCCSEGCCSSRGCGGGCGSVAVVVSVTVAVVSSVITVAVTVASMSTFSCSASFDRRRNSRKRGAWRHCCQSVRGFNILCQAAKRTRDEWRRESSLD